MRNEEIFQRSSAKALKILPPPQNPNQYSPACIIFLKFSLRSQKFTISVQKSRRFRHKSGLLSFVLSTRRSQPTRVRTIVTKLLPPSPCQLCNLDLFHVLRPCAGLILNSLGPIQPFDNLTQVGVNVDEDQISRKPLFLKFDVVGGQNCIAGFQSLFLGTGALSQDAGSQIKRSDYGAGYTAFCFVLSRDHHSAYHFEPIKQSNLWIELPFARPLSNTVKVIAYA